MASSVTTTCTERRTTISPLLRLPGEIRNLIYEFVFRTDVIVIVRCIKEPLDESDLHKETARVVTRALKRDCIHEEYPDELPSFLWIGLPQHYLTPLAVCRQIYRESRDLPYSLNTFYVRNSELQTFAELLSPHQKAKVRSMFLRTYEETSQLLETHCNNSCLRISERDCCDFLPRLKETFPGVRKLVLQRQIKRPSQVDYNWWWPGEDGHYGWLRTRVDECQQRILKLTAEANKRETLQISWLDTVFL